MILEKIKLAKFIMRECIVNFFGYKLGFRRLFRGVIINNITGNIKKDISDKGIKHNILINNIIEKLNNPLSKNTFVEIGPGGLLLHGLIEILDGWKEYIAVDAFKSDVWSDYPTEVYKEYCKYINKSDRIKIEEILKLKENNKVIKYYGKCGIFNKKFNNYVRKEKVDLIYSWGVMEHIDDPDSVFRKNYEILNKNGVAIHIIDTHPHTWHRFKNPQIMFTIQDWIWCLMYKGRGFVNRKLPGEYIKMAKNAGFKVDVVKREMSDNDIEGIKSKFIKRYVNSTREEILTHRIYVVLTK